MAGSNNMPTDEEKEEARIAQQRAEAEIAQREERARMVEQNNPKPQE